MLVIEGNELKMNKKCVLVTGASSGIGSSIARKFASNNYNIILHYNTHEEDAINLKKELENNYNIDCLCVKCDLQNEDDINNMYKHIKEKYEYIDVLVNNAGIAIDTLFEDKTKEQFMKTLEINLVAPFLLSKLFGEDMLKNKNGNIINISSTNGIDSYYQYSLDYDSSKAGLINLTHNLANHFAPYVRVNCICPGWVNTPMSCELGDEYIKSEENKILLNRFAEPVEIANLVYFLSSDEATYINDSIIKIDGGVKHGIN